MNLVIAGVGSRFLAMAVDQIIQLLILLGLVILMLAVGDLGGGGLLSVGIIAIFIVQFGYFMFFEALDSGRTPGKHVAGTRVVTLDGDPVGFIAVAVRNILRLVDSLPSFYLVALVAAATSPRGQRLGDMAAGTLVVRERISSTGDGHRRSLAARPEAHPAGSWDTGSWDTSAVTADDVATLRSFLERRFTIEPAARSRLAAQLAAALRPKVVGGQHLEPEAFLEHIVAVKEDRG